MSRKVGVAALRPHERLILRIIGKKHSVMIVDKNTTRLNAKDTAVVNSDCIDIPCGIWTEFGLIVWNYSEKVMTQK